MIQKIQDHFRVQVIQRQRADLDTVIIGSKWYKQLEHIPIGFDRMGAYPFDLREVSIKKLMHTTRQPHITSNWDLVNSINPARSNALLTLR